MSRQEFSGMEARPSTCLRANARVRSFSSGVPLSTIRLGQILA